MVPEMEEEISSSDDDSLWSDLQEVVEKAMADTSAGCSGSKLMNEARGPGDVICTTATLEALYCMPLVVAMPDKGENGVIGLVGTPAVKLSRWVMRNVRRCKGPGAGAWRYEEKDDDGSYTSWHSKIPSAGVMELDVWGLYIWGLQLMALKEGCNNYSLTSRRRI
ncbi:hypothetical protein F0562_008366 [Nyssa sinensis]|uniref:Uncharacterized protein n=1 Tax=Nyssa sinensis TaxID=561372 RepID=A0A5J5AAS3_9ASTE|nr:hypothetical protein F0562_008366 [Nyssa sinensis]